MPNYTVQDVDDLFEKGVITLQDRQKLRINLIQESNQEEGLLRKFVSHLSHQITEGWTSVKAGAEKMNKTKVDPMKPAPKRTDILTPEIELIVGSLQLLGSVSTAAGKASGEATQNYLTKLGVNPTVAAMAGVVMDIGGQVAMGGAISKAGKMIGAPARAANEAIKAGEAAIQSDAAVRKGVMEWMEQTLLTDKTDLAKKLAKKSADDEAAAIIETVNLKLKNLTATEKLLNKAAETVRGEATETTSTAATLEAAYQTMLGKKPAEVIANEMLKRPEIRRAAREMDKMAETTMAIRGGKALGGPEEIGAMASARAAFEKGAVQYEANKINMADLNEKAKASGTSIAEVLRLQFGEAKTPQEIANLSQPIKFYGEAFVNSVNDAEAALAKGDYEPFWRAMSEFNTIVMAHYPYMAPRQVAGQALKTYDEPVLSATRFLQQVPQLGSWMGKLKMTTAEEVEANAGLILREMQKVKSPSEIANFGRKVASEMADLGDEVLNEPTFRDKAHFYFVNSLMSGTDTIGRNIAGNALAVPWHYAEKVTSVAASKVLNPFLKAEHKLDAGTLSDANAGMSIWFRTMYDASRYAMTRQYDKLYGLIPDEQALAGLITNRYDLKKFATTGTTNPIGGMAGKIIGTPVGIAQTADEVSRIAAYRLAVGERLHSEWAASGTTATWRDFFEEGMNNVPPSVHEYGMRASAEFTFSDGMSRLGKVAMNARNNLPGSEFLATFIKTVDRLTAFQYNRSPVLSIFSSRLLDDLKSGDGALRAEAAGRVMLSSILGMGTFALARTAAPDGMTFVTGGGPTDRALATKLRDAKIHLPYTIWTPAGRVSYSGLAPLRGPLGVSADAAEIWDEIKNPEQASSLLSGIFLAGTRNFFDMSYTKQFADVFAIADRPESSRTSNMFERMAANVVKGFAEPSIVRQFMREIEPASKETHGFLDELMREIPGYGLPAKRNPLTNEPIMNPPRLLSDVPGLGWFLPTSPIQPATDAFANKIRELKLKLPEFPEAFAGNTASESPFAYSGPLGEAREARSGVPIPKDLQRKGAGYAFGAEGFGMSLNDEAQKLVADPEFNKLAPIDQAEAINGIYHSRYGIALDRLKEEHPELLEAYDLKMEQRDTVRMPQEDRAAYQRTQTAQPEPVEDVSLFGPEENR